MADPKTEHIKSPVPSALRRQAKQGRQLKISARAIGETGLASRKSAGQAIRGATVRIKAAKKGVYVGALHSELVAQKAVRSHTAPLRKLEQKVRKLARKFDPIATKKLPKGPRTILGGFAVPGIVRKMTERVQSLESKGRSKARQAGGYIPRGGGEA